MERDIENYLNQQLSNSSDIEGYKVEIKDGECQVTKQKHWEIIDILFCIVVLIFPVLMIACTIHDIKTTDNVKKRSSILLCFSAKVNLKDLHKSEGNNTALHVIYSVKFLLMLATVSAHSLMTILGGPLFNHNDYEMVNREYEHMVVNRGDLVVDIFFWMSGVLATYNYLHQSEKKYINHIRAIILRYIRLVPVYIIITFFYMTLLDKMSSGPIWNTIVGQEKQYCEQTWWTNLLLINNYVNVGNSCVLQGWFLACDFHLFIMSLPLNYLITKKKKTGLWVLFFCLCVSILVPFVVSMMRTDVPLPFLWNDILYKLRSLEHFKILYAPSHTRAGPFIVGMFFGYLYFKLKKSDFKLSVIKSLALMIVGLLLAMIVVNTSIVFVNPRFTYTHLIVALHVSLGRPVYALGMGLLIFALSHGDFDTIKKILGSKPAVVLSKLSFGVYMIHFAFQSVKIGSLRAPFYIDTYTWFKEAYADWLYGITVAIILYFTIENPIAKVMREVLPADKTKKQEEYNNTVTMSNENIITQF